MGVAALPQADDPRWVLKTIFSRKESTLPAAVLMSISFVCNGLSPVIIGRAIDDAIATTQLSTLWLWVVVLLITFCINAAASWFGRSLFTRAMLEIGHEMRMEVTDRIQDPKGMAGRQRTAGELLSIASSDTQRVAEAVIMTVFPVAEITSIIYVATMVSLVNLPLGIGVLIGGPLVVIISLKSATPLRKRSSKRQRALAQASATATDVVQGLRILKGLGAVDTVRARYQEVSDNAYDRTVEANGAQARLNAITEFAGAVYVVAVGIASGLMAMNGVITVGELITVVGLTQFIITPMTMLGKNIASRWATAQASGRRIQELLLTDASFTNDQPALPALEPGITVITGTAPEEIVNLPREKYLVAPHQADIFEGTVADNIHTDHGRAMWALEVASAEDIPGGPDREVGENGGHLSGGQRQRVALARAIAADAEILILQDPTTAVDSVTEHTIASRVVQARKDKPTIVYTNSPAWQAVGIGAK
ncbi:ABC transporter transmembrane domain-containing protein [Corynebacterium sp. L4756]|uniref:ABC transporter transmembrane domain-containing protein n=1 Tax=unclassified Corynebacterium TaxID=2624378 RepID=UPI00374C9CDA